MAVRKKYILILASVFICIIMQTTAFAAEEPPAPVTVEPPAKETAYPISVEEKVEQGYNIIVKTYALEPEESPDSIPSENFRKFDSLYVLSDIIKKDNLTEESMEHAETVTIDTAKNDLESILAELAPEIQYSEGGYEGVLKLDVSSVKCEPAGYKSSSYTDTKTREYPYLSSNDTALVPKSITEGSRSYTLADVQFKAQNTSNVDYEAVPDSYTAVAKYTATVSSKNVTGYTTTALYSGIITRTVFGKTIYTAKFIGDKVFVPIPEPEPEPEPLPEPEPKLHGMKSALPVILSILALLAAFGGGLLAYFLINRFNVTVFNQTGREFKKLCRLKLDPKAPELVLDLNKIRTEPTSGNFVIELSAKLAKSLEGREIRVLYDGEEIVQYIDRTPRRAKYQFEAKFDAKYDEKFEIEGRTSP